MIVEWFGDADISPRSSMEEMPLGVKEEAWERNEKEKEKVWTMKLNNRRQERRHPSPTVDRKGRRNERRNKKWIERKISGPDNYHSTFNENANTSLHFHLETPPPLPWIAVISPPLLPVPLFLRILLVEESVVETWPNQNGP